MTDIFVIYQRYRDTQRTGPSWGQWVGTQYRFDNPATATGCAAELRRAEEAKRRQQPGTEAEYQVVKNPKQGTFRELPNAKF